MNEFIKIDSIAPKINTNSNWRYLVKCSTKEARSLVGYDLALSLGVLPLAVYSDKEESLLSVVTNRALSRKELEYLRFHSGCRINSEQAEIESLEFAIRAAYEAKENSLIKAIEVSNSSIEKKVELEDLQSIESAIPALLKKILQRAELLMASDVHIEPYENQFRVRFRVFGQLQEDQIARLDKQVARNLVRCIKVKSKLENIYGPCDGKFFIESISSKKEIRVSILPLAEDDKAVLRIFANELEISNLSLPGLTQVQKHILESALHIDSGLIFTVGPTGSGKSTMLYSCLKKIDLSTQNVVSIEDPVEHKIQGVSQVDISRVKNMSYAKVLPYVLRQDPDILMLGEVRDAQTALLAFEAALTGKLVLSSVHCANTLEALLRLNELGISRANLANCLRLLISGRLVNQNCESCIEKENIPQRFIDYFELENLTYYKSRGCEECLNTGFSSRIGAYEFLPITNNIKNELLLDDIISLEKIKKIAESEGYQPYTKQILNYLMQGKISFRSACKSMGISASLFQA